jgi:hypothetical protein
MKKSKKKKNQKIVGVYFELRVVNQKRKYFARKRNSL